MKRMTNHRLAVDHVIRRRQLARALTIVLMLVQVQSTSADPQTASAYDPQEFTISYWCGPPATHLTLERFQEVKAANFTLALPPCGGLTVDENRKMLDLCGQVGIQAMISDSRMVHAIGDLEEHRKRLDAIIDDYADHPALLGYHIVDEPGAGAFEGLAEVVGYLRTHDPKHPGFINLLPTYATPAMLGTATYDEYVRKFADIVNPFVLSYDHYHFTNAGDRPDFFQNLQIVRDVSVEREIPFWNIVLVTQHFEYRHLTEPELRFEAMQTLAYGAKGLVWFTYWMPPGVPAPETWKHSLVNADGSLDAHYPMVQRVNADARAIGDVLVKAKSIRVFRHNDQNPAEPSDPATMEFAGGDLTVGVFEDKEHKTLAMVTNRDYQSGTTTQVAVRRGSATIEQFDPTTQTWSPAAITGEGKALVDLAPGGGVLLRW
jgi:hypothetical protein